MESDAYLRRCSRLVPNPDGPEAYSRCHLADGHNGDHRAWNPRTGGMLTIPQDPPEDERFDSLVTQTISLQRSVSKAIKLAVDVLNGPNQELRQEALDTLVSLADTMEDSAARLAELNT